MSTASELMLANHRSNLNGTSRRRFTTSEYRLMAEAGVFRHDEKTELIWGEVHTMLPTGRPHWVRVAELAMRLSKLLPASDWCVVPQSSIEVQDSMPEPDIVVLRGNGRLFLTREPKVYELALVIEVSDSSLQFDRGEKLSLYASAGVMHYWVVNLRDKQIEVYSSPEPASGKIPARYGTLKTLRQDDCATHEFESDLVFSIAVRDLFE